jgi:hypothetical protein
VQVRFRWLSYKQLLEVVANEVVPRNLVIEALMARLHNLENPKQKLKSDSVRYGLLVLSYTRLKLTNAPQYPDFRNASAVE